MIIDLSDVLFAILGYLVTCVLAAPRIMRQRYLDRLAEIKEDRDEFDRELMVWKSSKDKDRVSPWAPHAWKDAELRHNARFEGWWFSLIWPFALAFHRAGAHAFRKEISAAHATDNARIIADYDRLLAERFDKELEKPGPRRPLLRTLNQHLHRWVR